MKTQLGACRRTVPCNRPEALWITDDVLAAAFNNYTRRHVRHQSHVPGPLEAQKRAAKRKRTGFAHFSPPQFNPAILFPDKSQSAWWKSQPTQEHERTEDILPVWLRGPVSATSDGPFEPNVRMLHFESDLACCETPADLRALVRDHELNLRGDTAQSEAICEHVISNEWPTTLVAEYLADPVLNPLGCGNHLRILRQFEQDVSAREKGPRRFKDWSHMLQGLYKAVRLGLLSNDEWMQAVDTALAICAKIDGCENYRSAEGQPTLSSASVILSLWSNFRWCPVLDRKNIPSTWLAALPARAMANGFHQGIVSLIKGLGLGRRTSAFLEPLKLSLQRPSSSDKKEQISMALTIRNLSTAMKYRVLGQMTADLMDEVMTSQRPPAMLEKWMKVLRTLNTEVDGDIKYCVWLVDWDVHLLRPRKGRFQQDGTNTAALVLWIVHQLYNPTAASAADMGPPDCLDLLRRTIDPEGVQTVRSLHGAVLNALKDLPLPDKATLIARLPTLLRRSAGYTESELQATFAKFIAGDLAQITHTATYCYMRKEHPRAFVDAMQRVNNDLPAFRRLAQHTIAANKYLFKVIVRIIRHNFAFREALRQSWRITDRGYGKRSDGTNTRLDAPLVDQKSADRVKPATRAAEPANKTDAERAHNVDPAEALDTLHFLALNFAVSKAVPSRTALTKVYWCYKMLVRSRGPVQPVIVRALWYAGFERASNCGTARLMWLLRKVKEIEGPDVAMELMRNPEFRRRRKEAFEQVAVWANDEHRGPESLNGEMKRLEGEVTGWLKQYEQMERTVKEVMTWEAVARLQKSQALETLPEQSSVEEFERELAVRAEALENEGAEEDEQEAGQEPLLLWGQRVSPTERLEQEGGLVTDVWKPPLPEDAFVVVGEKELKTTGPHHCYGSAGASTRLSKAVEMPESKTWQPSLEHQAVPLKATVLPSASFFDAAAQAGGAQKNATPPHHSKRGR